jgi:hypothetical protein
VAFAPEVPHELGAGERAREPPAGELPRARQLGDPFEERLGARRGAGLHPDGSVRRVARALRVRRARGDLPGLARPEQVLGARHRQPHVAREDGDALGLGHMHVLRREEAARPADDVELEQLAAGVLGGAADLDPEAELGHLQHVSRLRHRVLLGAAWTMPSRRPYPARAGR